MHEFIKSPDDVLAISYSGTITSEDLDAALDRVEAMLEKPGKIHVFIEMRGIQLQLSAMPHHFARSLPLLGKLDRYGRVAVVADQAWIRVLTRLESAMLPNIKYRVYEPEERKEALDFAFGKELVTP
jgi:hypothetical protein